MDVTIVTKDAELDALHPDDYREIYDELRGYVIEEDRYRISLDNFAEMIHSSFSKALWSKYHRDEIELNRTMRNELRGAVGLPPLTPTIAEVMAQHVDPNAEVVKVGDEIARRVVLVGLTNSLTVSLNGSVTAEPYRGPVPTPHVTGVTRARKHVSLSTVAWERINAARLASGLSWEELLERALSTLTTDNK